MALGCKKIVRLTNSGGRELNSHLVGIGAAKRRGGITEGLSDETT